MILLLDNYDSFTYNLYQCIEQLGHRCRVIRNDAIDIAQLVAARATAGQLPYIQRWRELGFNDEMITKLSAMREAELEQSARVLLTDQIVGVR